MRILLVEDERSLSRAVAALLSKNNYSVDAVYDGEEAISYIECGNYDAMILDIMLPKLDGISVLKTVRNRGYTLPVLILSAKSEVDDKVLGLDTGANDYLTKPFEVRELLARIRAMTRSGATHTDSVIRLGNLELDTASYTLTGPSGKAKLANKEYQMLELMMKNPGRLIPTEMFMQKIWGYDSEAEINVVWVYVSYIRRKLSAVGSNVRISANRNAGYSLVSDEEEK